MLHIILWWWWWWWWWDDDWMLHIISKTCFNLSISLAHSPTIISIDCYLSTRKFWIKRNQAFSFGIFELRLTVKFVSRQLLKTRENSWDSQPERKLEAFEDDQNTCNDNDDGCKLYLSLTTRKQTTYYFEFYFSTFGLQHSSKLSPW